MIGTQVLRRAITVLVAGTFAVIPVTTRAQSEGIKVHGQWLIEVRNPDGTLAQRQEFNNALHSGGIHLTSLLSRASGMGFWEVAVYDSQQSPCLGGTRFPECEIVEPNISFTGTNVFKTLSVSTQGPNNNQLVLQGTATALVDGRISQVYSNFGTCPGGTGLCSGVLALPFTSHSLSTPIPVVAGQIIQVRVVISFA
jgi:hypothetical protein